MNFGGTTAAAPKPPLSGGLSREFASQGDAIRMPSYNSPDQLDAARIQRQAIMARSGRASTQLVQNPGTVPYQNSFLGGTI